jgi:8-hydroxy-5-deazaflavin:NADPH oxidoreductase
MAQAKVGILGSGTVGQKLAVGFRKSGHEVMIGTRSPDKLGDYLKGEGQGVRAGTTADTAAFGDILVMAAKWDGGAAESVIQQAGKNNFAGKILIDVTNPLVFTAPNQPPKLAMGFPDSAGATLQKWLPQAKVVKAFNIVTAHYMAAPKLQEGKPDMFVAGDDAEAKKQVMDIAVRWGWDVQEIGGIDQAYLLEALAMLWIRWGAMNNHWTHAFKLLKK